ncbi:TonB-dependent siderophore receptor [Caulobacter segnis]|uniref:TonB-dependent receptor n=1 Tax=Caulobacter segnis TaxID=88688 RepID=A0A2W5WDU0_9CAUL|nr:TonB-dependent receptor [Caulobacter segnis]PZR31758.1 MAG: hypothetical protein DI526_18685 [Caulobacter segnis]
MKKHILFAAVSTAAALTTTAAFAQSMDYGALAAMFEEPVTTSATGSPQRASQAPVNITILSADDIRRSGASDLPGLLNQMIGVTADYNSVMSADVAVRGFNEGRSPRLLVLVNGRQVYMDYFGFANWAAIPVELSEIQQLEVVKGPNTALFGFNAAAGVINIITKNARYAEPGTTVDIVAGTQNHRQVSVSANYRIGEKFSMRLSAGDTKIDEFSSVEATALKLQAVKNAGHLPDTERQSIAAEARYQLTPHQELLFEATHVNLEDIERYASDPVGWTVQKDTSWKAAWSLDSGENGFTKASLYRNKSDMQQRHKIPTNYRNNQVTVFGVDHTRKLNATTTVRAAFEWRRNELVTPPAPGRFYYDNYAVSGMWNWQATSKLALTVAARVDDAHSTRKGAPGVSPAPFPEGNSAYSKRITKVSYNAGAVYQLTPVSSLRLAASRGLQSPTLLEWGSQSGNLGNPAIQPTVVDNVELGYSLSLPKLHSSLTTTAWAQKTKDIKKLGCAKAPAGYAIACNAGDADAKGFDVSFKGGKDAWWWKAEYAFQDINSDNTPLLSANTNIIRYERNNAKHQTSVGGGWAKGPWELSANWSYLSARDYYDVTNARWERLEARQQVYGRAAYKINQHLTVGVTGENLAGPVWYTSGVKAERRVLARVTASF